MQESYLLLHHLVIADELTRSCHAGVRHAHRHLHTIEAAAHTRGKVAVLGVRGGFFERTKVVFAFIVFFLAAVATIGAFRAITAIVCPTMPVRAMLVYCLLSCGDCAVIYRDVSDILC